MYVEILKMVELRVLGGPLNPPRGKLEVFLFLEFSNF